MMGLFNYRLIITKQNTFSKHERLKSRKLIARLFSEGKSFSAFPLKVLYDADGKGSMILQAGVTVSSRHFKKAVHRNRIKRIIREAYRLNNTPLKNVLGSHHKTATLFFIYTGKVLPSFSEVSVSMETLLQRLVNEISKLPSK